MFVIELSLSRLYIYFCFEVVNLRKIGHATFRKTESELISNLILSIQEDIQEIRQFSSGSMYNSQSELFDLKAFIQSQVFISVVSITKSIQMTSPHTPAK